MKKMRWVFLAVVLLMASTTVGVADNGTKVVVSIKPVHSLVAAVMEGVGSPYLIVRTAASPHSFALKPSDARALENAGVVFWVGAGLESFLEKSLETLARQAKVVALQDVPGLNKLSLREGGAFEAHDEDEGTHDHGDEEHGDNGTDMHFWLDPVNAQAMVRAIEQVLSTADPDNAGTYRKNAGLVKDKLGRLIAEIESELAPVAGRPFIVFHDAYQYFEQRFGVRAAASVAVNPETTPGAGRLAEIRAKISGIGPTCVFSEPQFNARTVEIIVAGTSARAGVLDPLGAGLPEGPSLYFDLMREMAKTITTCLSQAH